MQSLFINYVQIFTVGNKLLSIKNITTWTIPHYIKQMNVKVVHINKTIELQHPVESTHTIRAPSHQNT